jgi:hypothetical protein
MVTRPAASISGSYPIGASVPIADLGQFLEGVQGRLPFRHGSLRQ